MKLTNRSPVFNPNRKYEEALEYHRQALVLIPQNASTYSAIGYIHSLMGNFESAIDYFHTVRNWLQLKGWSQILLFTVPLWFGSGTENQHFFSRLQISVYFIILIWGFFNLVYFID